MGVRYRRRPFGFRGTRTGYCLQAEWDKVGRFAFATHFLAGRLAEANT